METCTLPGCPIAGSGNPTTGRGEPPFFPAESTTPGEAAHVTDVFGPRNDCAGDADLLCESAGHQPEPPGPIIEPRASQMLLDERTSLQRSDVRPTDYTNPTIANNLFAAVQRDESKKTKACRPAELASNTLSIAPCDDHHLEAETDSAPEASNSPFVPLRWNDQYAHGHNESIRPEGDLVADTWF